MHSLQNACCRTKGNTMKEIIAWIVVAGLLVFGAGVTTGKIIAATTKVASGTPAPGVMVLTGHDATGKTKTAKATYNTVSFSAVFLSVDFTSDQFLCSAFGP